MCVPTEAQEGRLAGVLCGVGRKAVSWQEEGAPLLHLLAHAATRPGPLSAVSQEVREERRAHPAPIGVLQQQRKQVCEYQAAGSSTSTTGLPSTSGVKDSFASP
jgi:hypothetical protein